MSETVKVLFEDGTSIEGVPTYFSDDVLNTTDSSEEDSDN